ncbi:hypothetical protein LX32DRAFT_173113 [Colletotrichum zoysiae]|uniref:Uncharacterized protein n=1 Tax=Colletotrichum zoysiae TaxID=1216348 RepID=A0AAD9LYM2_9PEZI|nr:hypothetical protein LX32DRAFT_173113 [Colletotrichum zoysiae]
MPSGSFVMTQQHMEPWVSRGKGGKKRYKIEQNYFDRCSLPEDGQQTGIALPTGVVYAHAVSFRHVAFVRKFSIQMKKPKMPCRTGLAAEFVASGWPEQPTPASQTRQDQIGLDWIDTSSITHACLPACLRALDGREAVGQGAIEFVLQGVKMCIGPKSSRHHL